MRYFLVSYAHPEGFGNICITANLFPTQKFIRDQISAQMYTSQIVIISIFEFKNLEDFRNFQITE